MTRLTWIGCASLVLCGLACAAAAQDPRAAQHVAKLPTGKPVLELKPIQLEPNLLPNASFEEVDGGRPTHWTWDRRNTDATLTVDDTTAHTGRHSMRLTNSTPFGPHVYALLSLPDGAQVQPNSAYTFSCYVKCETGSGIAWFGGGREWLVRAPFPRETNGQWVRVVLPFTTGPDDRRIPVMIATESPTAGFWVDDVQLVAGKQPMPIFNPASKTPMLQLELPPPAMVRFRGRAISAQWNPTRFPPDRYAFAAESLWTRGFLHLPHPARGSRIMAQLAVPGGPLLGETSEPADLEAGTYQVTAGFPVAHVQSPEVELVLRLGEQRRSEGNTAAVSASLKRRLVTAATVNTVLERVDRLRQDLHRRVESLRRSGQDPAYPLATLTVLDNFLDYARQDLAQEEVARAYDAALEMESLARRALARQSWPQVPRYVTAAKRPSFRLDGSAQLGSVRWPDGRLQTDWPLQFVGVGAFGQVKSDLEKLSSYGLNIIQVEFGPNSVLVGENQVDTQVVDEYLALLDRAAKAGVAVNLLLSPHYFPEWALQKWPHLNSAEGGFLKYDVHAPEARAVLEKFLRTAIPRIAGHPALHSFCLSNEPVFTDMDKSKVVRAEWHDWLRARHATIDRLNERWGSSYADFQAIPIPTEFGTAPIIYDFTSFNTETFAQWHAWMASIIRDLAPDVPLHAKIMICAALSRSKHGAWCVAPELFAELSDINGNDAWKYYSPTGPWADGWPMEQMGYDFQRSMADKLVFNSENHLIPDRNFAYVPPSHITNVFWQGAIHGQSATVTWVWERTFDNTSDMAGSILHRPACSEAMGRAGLDLLRLGREVRAFQKLPPQVALVWSPASVVAGEDYLTALERVYEGLDSCGLRLGFITERQLASFAQHGKLPEPLAAVKVIVAPRVLRTPESTLAALGRYQAQGGTVLAIGDCFTQDEYGKSRHPAPKIGTSVELPADGEAAFDLFQQQIVRWPVSRLVEVTGEDGKAVWGVEYLATQQDGRLLVNLSNYRREPLRVRVLLDGKAASGTDLRSGQSLGSTFELPSLEPVLLQTSR